MAMKRFDDMGKSLTQTWSDEADMIEFKNGEVKEIRIVGEGYLPVMRHWVPFMRKKGGIGFFPHDCQRYNVKTGDFDYNLECEACDRELRPDEHALMFALDVDLLFDGNTDKALGLILFGGREQQKIQNLTQFNKVDKAPYSVTDPKYGCAVQVLFDKDNRDKSLRWQFTKSQRIAVAIKGDTLRVKVPKEADSDHAGEIFEFELYDLSEIVYPVDANKARDKFRIWKVDEALELINKEDGKSADDDAGKRRSQQRRAKEADAGDPKRRSTSARKPKPAEDEEFDEDFENEDPEEPVENTDEEQEADAGADEDFEDEPKPQKPKLSGGKKTKLQAKKQKPAAGSEKKKTSKPHCFGRVGQEDTEDCALCSHEEACAEQASSEGDLDD